jgi:4'-phosphopantetheinyl transferase
MPGRLTPGTVEVRWARVGPETAGFEAFLDAEERDRQARFRRPEDRDVYGLAHGLLRWTLSRHADVEPAAWRFAAGRFQKPLIAAPIAGSPPLAFSLTHADGIAAVAVARGIEVGVDAEPVDRVVDPWALADGVLSPPERSDLGKLDPEAARRAFMRLWTLKEAHVKGLGLGLSHPVASSAFRIDPSDGGIEASLGPAGGQWRFRQWVVAGRFVIAVAGEVRGGAEPRFRIVGPARIA